jgi:hypothetical protein
MGEKTCRDQVRVAIPIRVRGMSSQNKFFDEQTETDWVGEESVACHLQNLVDLDTEVHLTNLQTNVGGTFRVLWTIIRDYNGLQPVGLELLDPEGDLWAMTFPAGEAGEDAVAPQVWLQCQGCHQKLLTPVPEAQGEFLCEGFRVARHCEQCRATAPWGFTTETQTDAPAPAAAEAMPKEDQRAKGRAPLTMIVKVTRKKYGTTLQDLCQTINVSRTGAYFLTSQNYEVGEPLEVVINYKEGDLAIPAPAKVVRQDQPQGTFLKGVAIQLMK